MDVPVPEDLAILIGGLVLTLAYLALGYYLGRDALGPDANWWGPLRRTLIPRLDRVLSERGMYAENRALDAEFVGFVPETPEAVEEYLYERGYLWNFAAGLKENPDGVVEYSSWARRQVRDPRLRRAFASLEGVRFVGLAVEIVEAVIATRQDHAFLFDVSGGTMVYAHEEPNAINPLMYVAHYRPGRDSLLGDDVPGMRRGLGVRRVGTDLLEAGAPLELSTVAIDAGVDPVEVAGDQEVGG